MTCFQFWAINPPLLAPLSDLKQFDQAAEIALLFSSVPCFRPSSDGNCHDGRRSQGSDAGCDIEYNPALH